MVYWYWYITVYGQTDNFDKFGYRVHCNNIRALVYNSLGIAIQFI